MGKFRYRVKGKGKRWPKGQSSNSNPSSKKFRDAAKSQFFQENLGPGGLTVEAVKKHDVFDGTIDSSDVQNETDDKMTNGTFGSLKSLETYTTNWSECTNMSFGKLFSSFSANSALHKEMLAVLAAVTEVIKANGGKETTTEYFAALVTTLEVTETEDSTAAVLAVLHMGIKFVPANVLQSKFSETSKTFINIFEKYVTSDNNAILRSLIGCISALLSAQELAVWNSSSTLQIFDSILLFTIHSKPKIRKAAQNSIYMILKCSTIMSSEQPPPHHPAAPHTAEFCKKQIECESGTTVLHVLTLLEKIVSTFPKKYLKIICESIFKIMSRGNVLVTSWSLHVLNSLFSSSPSISFLPPVLNGQIISALYDYQPSINDTQPMLAWLSVLLQAHLNLAVNKSPVFYDTVKRLFLVMTDLWRRSDNVTVLSEIAKVLCGVTRNFELLSPSSSATVEKVFHQVENCLRKYEYRIAEPYILQVLATFYEVVDKNSCEFIIPCLQHLAEKRDTYNFSNAKELEYTIGRAVRFLGPEIVLRAIPLNIHDEKLDLQFKRSWMLPVLRENICSSTLGFFIGYFIPLATKYKNQSIVLAKENNSVSIHSLKLLENQIWSLLPQFCNNPPDVVNNFKVIAKCLGTAIADHKEIRLHVLSALKKLICSCKESGNIKATEELGRFAKNYLPILFNLYTTKPVGSEEEGHRVAAYETIKVYISISDEFLCTEMFEKAFEKLSQDTTLKFVKESIMDLLRALLPYQNEQKWQFLLNFCENALKNSKDHRMQKKSYRLLEELCSNDSARCKEFAVENLDKLQTILINTSTEVIVSSKAPRLRCIICIVQKLKNPSEIFFRQIIPEAVVSCKDVNERCRSAAFKLLEEIGMSMKKFSTDKSDDDILREYIGFILAGLTGTPAVISCTLLALAKVIYRFSDILPHDVMSSLLENISVLVITPTREIVGACLSFIKVFISSYLTPVIAPFVPKLVKGLVNMTDDCKRHFRIKTARIFDRLTKKFGYEDIIALVPESDVITRKRLNNLRKIQARNKRVKMQKETSFDEEMPMLVKSKSKSMEEILKECDDSDFETDDVKSLSCEKKVGKPVATWIQEHPDTITDLTDTKVTEKITATKPDKSKNTDKSKLKNKGFKTAPDGRLMIFEDGDLNDDNDLSPEVFSDSDSESEHKSSKKKTVVTGRKRKISIDEQSESEPQLKYQAGGKGIHRPLKQKKISAESCTYGSEYKAKKAKGDVKQKGKPDPYAYIPLSRKFLNKRKKAKISGQFKNLVGAARKGAQKGTRNQIKAMKRKL